MAGRGSARPGPRQPPATAAAAATDARPGPRRSPHRTGARPAAGVRTARASRRPPRRPDDGPPRTPRPAVPLHTRPAPGGRSRDTPAAFPVRAPAAAPCRTARPAEGTGVPSAATARLLRGQDEGSTRRHRDAAARSRHLLPVNAAAASGAATIQLLMDTGRMG
ncbi:hypothetical protein GCM10017687_34950 [Streptomyces echinatus]